MTEEQGLFDGLGIISHNAICYWLNFSTTIGKLRAKLLIFLAERAVRVVDKSVMVAELQIPVSVVIVDGVELEGVFLGLAGGGINLTARGKAEHTNKENDEEEN